LPFELDTLLSHPAKGAALKSEVRQHCHIKIIKKAFPRLAAAIFIQEEI
jgi:hypothetical protein